MMADMPRCPRCNSDSVSRGGPHHTEFVCNGPCLEEHKGDSNKWEYTYFQYDADDNIFCWPAVGVMWKCDVDDIDLVRQGKMKPGIV